MNSIDLLLLIAGIFFAAYMIGYSLFMSFGGVVSILKLRENRIKQRMENELNHNFYFPISILVPAYNEEQTILTTVTNLLELDYKLYEIVVIDDGSTDATAKLIIDTFRLKRDLKPIRIQVPSKEIKEVYTGKVGSIPIVLVRKMNGGNKADAVNAGINTCSYPYFVSMDADEVLQADALQFSARLFLEDDSVIAVGGQIGIANGVEFERAMPTNTRMSRNPIASMQVLEYIRAFIASRIFHDTFNGNLNVSGGYGLFKKEAVIAIGGYDTKSIGEDMDLVMRLHLYFQNHMIPYSIKYTSDAVCWTQAPFTIRDLWKQRTRWHRGLMQCMWNYRTLFLNRKYKSVSLVSYSYYFLYELMAPLLELIGILVIVLAFATDRLNVQSAILIASLYIAFNLLQTILFYMSKSLLRGDKFNKGDIVWTFLMTLSEILVLRPFMFVVRLYATFTYKQKLHSWSSIQREKIEAN